MTRQALLDSLSEDFDSGRFFEVLARRIAFRTESQVQESFPHLRAYLVDEIGPELDSMGYEQHLIDNPVPGRRPIPDRSPNRRPFTSYRPHPTAMGM